MARPERLQDGQIQDVLEIMIKGLYDGLKWGRESRMNARFFT